MLTRLDSLPNFRDLGANDTTIPGKKIRRGFLFRSSAFLYASEEEFDWCCRNMHTVIDLRDSGERKQDNKAHPQRVRRLHVEFPIDDYEKPKAYAKNKRQQRPHRLPRGAAEAEAEQRGGGGGGGGSGAVSPGTTSLLPESKDASSHAPPVKVAHHIPLLPRKAVAHIIRRDATICQMLLYVVYAYLCCAKQKATRTLLPAFWAIGLRGLNQLLIEHSADRVLTVLDEITVNADRPLLFYCSAGKDRTGFIAALVLHILGVPRERIVHDYSLSGSLLPLRYHQALQAIAAPQEFLESPADLMEYVFEELEKKHGSVDGYLDSIGFDEASREALRAKLLDDA